MASLMESNGQFTITIPKEVVEATGLKKGDQIFVETKNIQGKETKDFVFDTSDPKNQQAMEKAKYYSAYVLEESKVRRLKLKEVLKRMSGCLERRDDMWSWVE